MIVSILKKICFVSMLIALCVVPVAAKKNNKEHKHDNKESKRSKSLSGQCTKLSCSTNPSSNDCNQVRDLIDRQLTDKLRKLNAELDRSFGTQNTFICSKIELLTACLDEFIATQQRASDIRLKDFITCSLDRTETNIEEFTRNRVDILKDELCIIFEALNENIRLLMCIVDNIDGNVDCIANTLFEFLNVANALPFFDGALDDVISAAQECLESNDCLLTCSDALPGGCVSDLATVGCNTSL